MKRSDFVKAFSLGSAAMALPGCVGRKSGDSKRSTVNHSRAMSAGDDLKKAWEKAAARTRRMIMNNDGHDFNNLAPGEAVTPEMMLSKRTLGLVGTHVDSIFYCTGVFNSYTHWSDESDLRSDEGKGDPIHFHELIRQGTDSLEVMADFCHQHGLEIFWSMRMNDKHEATRAYYTSLRWKKENPQCLIGRVGQDKLRDRTWRYMLDYAVGEAREKVFRILRDVSTRYDVDGLELDFFRHPVFFLPQALGEPVTQEHCEMMTDLLRRVRRMAEEEGAKRGRPMLISIRAPDSVGYCKAIGLDLERWLEEDLIDILVGGGYFKLEPWVNLASLGKKHGVPVYACLVSRRVVQGGEPEVETTPEGLKRWRGEALNAWENGVNGIYTFNRFNPYDRIFRELGDPELLKALERVDQTIYADEKGFTDPAHWLQGGRKFLRPDKRMNG